VLASVQGHHLELGEPAHRAGDRRLGDERGHAWRNGLVKPVIPVRADCGGACPLVAGGVERSPDRVGFTLRATGAGESQDQSKRLFRAGPEFAQHWLAARSDEVAEDECDDDRVVELAGHRNEVRDEVEGQAKVDDEGDQQQLAAPWHAGVAREARHEHDAVRDERGKCTCVLTAPADHKPRDERGVHRKDDAERD
jgi:hypothetical protein